VSFQLHYKRRLWPRLCIHYENLVLV